MWTSRTRASSSRTAPSPTSPPAASPGSARASSASSSRRGISPSTWRRGAGTSSGCGRGGRGSAPPRSSRSSSTCGSTPPKRSRSSWSSRASCARCAARKPSWCRAPPGRRPWRSPAASRTPSRPRPSPTRGREPRAPHLRLGGRAVGGRARRRRGDGVATAPPGGRVRGVRRPEPRGRRCHRARPHGADVGRGIRRGAVEASRALPPACAGARGVPDQALRSRHPGRLPGVPSARRGGGARRRRSRAVLHRAAAVGLGPGAGAPARRREPPRGDPAVRGNVLPRPRRARDVRRASAAGPATAAGPGRGPPGARARPRAPGARAVSREPDAGGAAALAGVPRRRGARAGRAAGRPGRRRRHVARPLSAPGRHPHSLGRSAPRVRRRGRGAVQIGDDHARGGVGRRPHGHRLPAQPRVVRHRDPRAAGAARRAREPDRRAGGGARVPSGGGDPAGAGGDNPAAARSGGRRGAAAAPGSRPGARPAWPTGGRRSRGGARGGARRVTVGLAAGVMRLLAATWRYRVRGWEHVAAARATGRPIVYVLWHSRILPLLYRRRGARLRARGVVDPVVGPVLHPQALRRGGGRVRRPALGRRGEGRPAPGGGGGGASAAGGDLRGRGKREEGRVRGARVAQWLWGGAPLARVARLPLVPLAALYWGATRVRAAMYRAGWRHVARLPFPTVAVGNLSVGGTGKTPLAAWIARYYAQRGRRPAILLRGYGGDEPLVHQRLAPEAVVVADPDRVAEIGRA